MNINKDNYEEYFLLYADNELSAEERIGVERFVRENKSFKHEFDQLNNTVLEPEENFRLLDKSFLYKKAIALDIDESNYEEIFVLYHDGELNEAEQYEVLAFLEAHSELKQDFDLIRQAQIEPEILTFPEKSSLYRKVTPAGNGRVVLFRSLAAAAMAGLLLWGSLSYLDSQDNPEKIVLQINQTEPAKTVAIEKIEENKEISDSETVSDIKIEDSGVALLKIPVEENKSIPEKKNNIKEDAGNYAVKKLTAPDNKPSPKMAPVEIIENKLLAKISQEEIPANLTTASGVLSHIDINMTETIKEPVSIATTAVYLDVDNDESDDYIFYNISVSEFQKSKVGIFLKKVKRIAERNDPIKRLFSEDKNQIVINK